jgi:hypothetical protein
MEFPAIAGFGAGTSLFFFFFRVFFSWLKGAHKSMLFLEGWGCRYKYFHFYGF